MQLKWILAIIITAIVVGVTGNTFYGYKKKTDQIASFLSGYGSSFVVDYENIKMTSLGSDIFTIRDLSITSKNIKLNSEAATINIKDMAGGKFTLYNTDFNYFDYRGHASSVSFQSLAIDKIDKDVSVQFDGVSLSRNSQLIENGTASIVVKQAYDNVQLDVNVTGFEGDSIFFTLKSKMDKESLNNGDLHSGLYNGNIVYANTNIKSVSVFGKLLNEYPSIRKDINDFGLNFVKHHYPKSKAEGAVLLDFLKNQKTISVSIEPKSAVAPKHIQALKKVDSLTLFEQLNLNIKK